MNEASGSRIGVVAIRPASRKHCLASPTILFGDSRSFVNIRNGQKKGGMIGEVIAKK